RRRLTEDRAVLLLGVDGARQRRFIGVAKMNRLDPLTDLACLRNSNFRDARHFKFSMLKPLRSLRLSSRFYLVSLPPGHGRGKDYGGYDLCSRRMISLTSTLSRNGRGSL